MSAVEIMGDDGLAPSCAWEVCGRLFGDVRAWEPDVFRIELARKRIYPSAALMSKILAAQTIVTTDHWLRDHDCLFAFALSCDGIPAAADALNFPDPEVLAWSMHEIRRLRKLPDDLENEGFDPDEVDPAIACLLLDHGFCRAPEQLAFVQPCLDRMAYQPEGFEAAVTKRWADWSSLDAAALHGKASGLSDLDPVDQQIARLAGVRAYCLDREASRAQQHARISF